MIAIIRTAGRGSLWRGGTRAASDGTGHSGAFTANANMKTEEQSVGDPGLDLNFPVETASTMARKSNARRERRELAVTT